MLSLGSNPDENINKLVELVGEELGASTAIYLFLKEDVLYSKGSWGLPNDYQPHHIAQGQMSYDMIKSKNKEGVLIKDLYNSKYYQTDPDVKEYGMKSYLGFPVRFDEQIKGCICVTYNPEHEPTFEDQKFVGIISSAIAVEEERNRAMELLKNSIEEKDVLLKEVYHRVKNNLQVISSLLYLQSTHIKDKELLSMFNESQNRVKSMALVHEKLYQSKDLAKVNVSEYVNSLVVYLLSSYSVEERIKINVDVHNFLLEVDKIIPCGLIINELISNAIKYAFPNNFLQQKEPRIDVIFEQKEGLLSLVIFDNGIGLPESYNFGDNAGSLGMRLVKLLSSQIEGTIKYSFQSGAKFEILFPST